MAEHNLFADEKGNILEPLEIREDVFSWERMVSGRDEFDKIVDAHLYSLKKEKQDKDDNKPLVYKVLFEKDIELVRRKREMKALKQRLYDYVKRSVKTIFSEPDEQLHYDITTFENVNYGEISETELTELKNLLNFFCYRDCAEEELGNLEVKNINENGVDGIRMRYGLETNDFPSQVLGQSERLPEDYETTVQQKLQNYVYARFGILEKMVSRIVIFEKFAERKRFDRTQHREEWMNWNREEKNKFCENTLSEFYLDIARRMHPVLDFIQPNPENVVKKVYNAEDIMNTFNQK